MNYKLNLLHHVGVVAKLVRAAAAHEGDDNTPSGPTGRGVKTVGSRTDPCGTPLLVVCHKRHFSLTLTRCSPLERYE